MVRFLKYLCAVSRNVCTGLKSALPPRRSFQLPFGIPHDTGAIFLFEAFDGLEETNGCPRRGTMEPFLNVTHPFTVPGEPDGHKSVEKAEARSTVE